MFISPTEAVKIYNVSKPTLYEDMKNGRLSFQKNERKKRRINVSELDRIYDKRANKQEEENGKERNEETEFNGSKNSKSTDIEIRYLKELNKQQKEQLEAQIQSLQGALDKAQEGQNRLTLLLEDKTASKSRAGEWEKPIKAMEARLANQETASKEIKEREEKILRQNKALKNTLQEERKALKEERSKGFFKKLFR